MSEDRRDRRLGRSAALLAALVFAVAAWAYAPCVRHGFVAWDDATYVAENPVLALGLSGEALRRAFEPHDGNWIPLTWLSLAVDHAAFGDAPAGYHAVNLLWHAATAALLLLALARATGALAPAAFVALCFALHPLRVESVAWVAERKDVLSGFFFVATLAAWIAYARRPGALRYAAALALGALGLLAKATAVTLPFVLLLLDFWPLGRLGDRAARRRALVEKVPFLALAAFVAERTWSAQQGGGALGPLADLPLDVRAANAIVSYLWYAKKAFAPAELAAFYPHPRVVPPGDVVGWSLFVLIAVTLAALALAPRRPWLACGWLWFLGMLVPMIGLVQVGMQAHADRYAYLPLLGLEIAVAYEAWAWLGRGRAGRAVYAAATAGAALALGVAMRGELAHWRDTESLFSRALAVTDENFLAHERVGEARLAAGDTDAAVRHFGEALRIDPKWGVAKDGLARALWKQGRRDEALWNHREAVRLDPTNGALREHLARALIEMGWNDEAIQVLLRGIRRVDEAHVPRLRTLLADQLARRGDVPGAIRQAQHAVAAAPRLADAWIVLGRTQLLGGDAPGAERSLRTALALGSEGPLLRSQLGDALQRQGRDAEAAAAYRAALGADPTLADAANNLSWILAASRDAALRDPAAALRLAETVATATQRRDPNVLDTLAVAQAANGRFEDAVATIDAALALLPAERAQQAASLAARRALFAARTPYVDAAPTP